jgi:hypothetical protein
VGLAISLIDYEDFHHFKVIEKKNKIRLDREQVKGFEVDESVTQKMIDANKPTAKPAGTGKKKRKKQQQADSDVWLKK